MSSRLKITKLWGKMKCSLLKSVTSEVSLLLQIISAALCNHSNHQTQDKSILLLLFFFFTSKYSRYQQLEKIKFQFLYITQHDVGVQKQKGRLAQINTFCLVCTNNLWSRSVSELEAPFQAAKCHPSSNA